MSYQEYFMNKMKEFGVSSPKELTPEQFEEIDKGWDSKAEKTQADLKALKIGASFVVKANDGYADWADKVIMLMDVYTSLPEAKKLFDKGSKDFQKKLLSETEKENDSRDADRIKWMKKWLH